MEQVVYAVIAWMSVVVMVMMGVILWITHHEIKNSRREMALKMILHYNHKFHRMKIAFEKHNIFKVHLSDTGGIKDHFSRHNRRFQESIPLLANEISQNCATNAYTFIRNEALKEELVLVNKNIMEGFQQTVYAYHAFEDKIIKEQEALEDHWEAMTQEYNSVLDQIILCHELLSNNAYQEVI